MRAGHRTRRGTRGGASAAARGLALAAALASWGAAREAGAQARAQLRADLLLGEAVAAHAGAGAELDAGLYARVAFLAGVGVARADGGPARLSGRGEAVMRFVLDPLRQSRTGLYLAGGVGVRRDGGASTRAYLHGALGVEGARRGTWAPSLEVGVGGGARVGVVLRRARPDLR